MLENRQQKVVSDVRSWLLGPSQLLFIRELVLVAVVVVLLVVPLAVEIDALSWASLGAIFAFGLVAPRSLLFAAPFALGLSFTPFTAGVMQLNMLEVLIFPAAAGIFVRLLGEIWRSRDNVLDPIRGALQATFPDRLIAAVVALTLIAGLISLFTLADPDHSRESLRTFRWTIMMPILFFLSCGVAMRRDGDRYLLGALLMAGGALASIIAVVDGLAGGAITADSVTRLSGMASHPNALALYLERVAVFGILVAFLFRMRPSRWWLLAGAVASMVTILTFSRGAFLGMAAGIILILVVTQLRRLAVYVAALGSVTLGILVVVAPARTLSLLGGGSGSLRLELWRSSVEMTRDNPLWGVGLDQFLYQYLPRYVSPTAWLERFTSHPHNLVLEAWLSLGIIGVGLVALIGAFWFVRVRDGLEARDRITLAAGGALFAVFVHGMLDRAYFLPELAVSAWLFVFLMGSVAGDTQPQEQTIVRHSKG